MLASSDEHPCRLQDRECNQSDDGSCADQHWIAHLEPEQHGETDNCNEDGQPVADRDAAKQDAGAEDGADGSGVCAFDEALDVQIAAMAAQNWCCDQDQQERQHQEAMEATAKLEQDGGLQIADERKDKTDVEMAAELRAKGVNVHLNEEGQITDKRELLTAGLCGHVAVVKAFRAARSPEDTKTLSTVLLHLWTW